MKISTTFQKFKNVPTERQPEAMQLDEVFEVEIEGSPQRIEKCLTAIRNNLLENTSLENTIKENKRIEWRQL